MSKSSSGLLQRAGRLTAGQWNALPMAVWLLAKARHEHARKPIKAVLQRFQVNEAHLPATPAQAELISWAIASAAARVPWRSDCLLQAMAASMWLDRTQTGYRLNIGVRKNAQDQLEAHAWLTSGDITVTGGVPNLDSFATIPLECGISRL